MLLSFVRKSNTLSICQGKSLHYFANDWDLFLGKVNKSFPF